MRVRVFFLCFLLLGLLFALFQVGPQTADASQLIQQPSVEIATVTSTPAGPMVTVRSDQEEYINVRSGPGVFFPKAGVLLIGQQAPAKGRSVGGDWILISYPGVPGGVAWVYAPFVNLSPGSLPIVEPPPTPTPLFTPTIDSTLAAQFIITIVPTRLPSFTPPPPLVIPTFTSVSSQGRLAGVPIGFVIIGLAASGLFLGLFSIAQGR